MDRNKFDEHLMGFLYGELDEVTTAAMRRQVEADQGSRELYEGLQETVAHAELPMEEPSDDLESRILLAAKLASSSEPWHRRIVRSLAWAGSHVMQPQLAMAALVALVLGSSVLLLRAKPGAVAVQATKDGPSRLAPPAHNVSETGSQTGSDGSEATASPNVVGAASSAPLVDDSESFEKAMKLYKDGQHQLAQKAFADVRTKGGPKAPLAALYEARAIRAHEGCAAALARYQSVREDATANVPGAAGLGADATWELADCNRILGRRATARQLWLSLRKHDGYGPRAVHELSVQGDVVGAAPRRGRAKPKAGSRAPAPAPRPAPPPARKSTHVEEDVTNSL